MAAGMKDVASLAGVAVGTVSNVLNHPDLVRPLTRARVEAAMEQLGFIPNGSARQLRAGRSRCLGLVVLDVTNPFLDRKSTRLNSSHVTTSRMPSSA